MVNSPSLLLRIFDFCSTRSLMAALELAVAATSSSSAADGGGWKSKQKALQTNRNGRLMSNSSNLNRKKQRTQSRTTPFAQCATSSVAAGVDAVVMIAALFACAYLFLPYLQLLFRGIKLTFSALVQSANDECAMLVFNVFGISFVVLVVGVLFVIIVRYALGGKKCNRPNCLGLKDSPKFDFQIETEEMMKNSTASSFSEPSTSSKDDVLIELSGDHQREIEGQLRKVAPPNGRILLIFRAKCGCSAGRMVVWGPKKSTKIKNRSIR